ncbi:MAG: OpgC domain-containing protein [Methylococcaceae bacterium]|nr:OpgC domain-containing protein [Methylococcaceae bacterium]
MINNKNTSRNKYPGNSGGRDLRLDFLRGLIMLVVIVVHMEYYSFFSMFVWERIGLISSAEGFVGLSGIVLGIVYKNRLLRDGFKSSAIKLWKRSFQLYRINVFIVLSIALLGLLPFINVFEVTHWIPNTQRSRAFLLYPADGTPWVEIFKQAFLLKIGPHQFQVIGLYVGLIATAPFVLYFLHRKKTIWLMVISFIIYGINQKYQFRITGARFEWGFPTLTWQLIFINGMVVGYHQEKILGYITERKNKILVIIASCFSLAFLFLALNNPNAVYWPLRDLAGLDGELFRQIYLNWFQKPTLGLGRIFNNITLFIVFYYALTHYWFPINKALGWLVIPLGQASLYVFIVHIYFILLFSNTPLGSYDSFILNTAIHATAITLIWLMVKHKVLFQLIPR